MKMYKEKPCKECGVEFEPGAPCGLYCSEGCLSISTKRSNREKNARHRAKQGRMVGVGSGNAQGSGETHHTYTNGIKGFSQRKLKSMTLHKCEDCDLDLSVVIGVHRYEWTVHHVDGDRTNNELSNLRLLCKRCHQVTHKCHENFYKV